ncbi:MAG: efflux RND transporter periplasmic adaptor subunit, partial [Pseudomonadota bacterium]
MRLTSLLTALLVAVALYALIMERDALRAFANGADVSEGAVVEPVAVADPDAAVSVVVLRSEARPVQSGIVLSGQTEAARFVEVRSETTGLVISEPIRKGTPIARGDELCRLDPGTREATLSEARARLLEAETNNSTAQQLSQRGFSSETDAISKQAALESAEAMVEQAEKELQRLTITAPFDGILETDTAELGSLLQPGGACATLISLNPIKLVGFVPEQDVERLDFGAPAGARLITGQVLSGQVSFLSRSADEVTRTFRVEIQVPNEDQSIRDGVTAEIMIGLDGATGHLVPQSALTLNDTGEL